MQINNITTTNRSFGAKIKVKSVYGEVKIPEPKNRKLIEKAKKIGLENDVIEFSFGPIIRKTENYWSPQDNFFIENWRSEVKNKLTTKFTQEGKVKEHFKETVYQSDYGNILDDNEERIEEILGYLHKKYPNDIWN